MGFLSGLKKVKRYMKLPDGYKLLSIWTSSQSVEMDDGSTLESNKPNWDDKYTRSEVDNKLSAIETNIDWKESVDTFTDISTAYPDPQDGWTVNVRDTDYTYRYNGEEWVVISANAIPKATQAIDGLLTKEDKTSYDSAVEKKHEHDNKSALDMITSEKIAGWDELSQNSVTGVKGNKEETYRSGNVNITAADIGAVDKSGDTMTGTLTAPTFSGNLEGTFHGISDKQIAIGNHSYGWEARGYTGDLNTWIDPGTYASAGSGNCTNYPPITDGWGTITVLPSVQGRVVQIFNPWNGSGEELYYRSQNGDIWSGWKLMSNHSYAMCTDSSTTTAKAATSSNFCLRQYHRMTVYFVNGSNAISTLQINNDAARRVYYKAGGFDKTIPRGCFIDMIYIDGSWYICGGVDEPANSVAEFPVKCNSMQINPKSVHTLSDFGWSSDNGYGSVAGSLSDSGINSFYVAYASAGSSGNASGKAGYKILKEGCYWLKISSFPRTISPGTSVGLERVKRVRLDVYQNAQSSGESIMINAMRATPWECIQCHTIAYLTQNCIIVPVLQVDSNGSTVISGTFDYSLEIMPLFVK